jgi:hypothetical protein
MTIHNNALQHAHTILQMMAILVLPNALIMSLSNTEHQWLVYSFPFATIKLALPAVQHVMNN